ALGDWLPVTTVRTSKPLPEHPTPVQAVLGGVWCSHGSGDLEGLAISLAGKDALASASALRALALDASLPGFMRGRALGAYARAAGGKGAALDLAEAVAKTEGEETDLRAAGLRVLHKWDPARSRKVAGAAKASTDVIVRAIGERLVR